jgi:RNA-binding protein
LRQVGTILHRAKSGRLIVRLSSEVKTNAMLLDKEGKRLGKIIELIGPVRAPYASVSLATSRAGRGGDPAFVEG